MKRCFWLRYDYDEPENDLQSPYRNYPDEREEGWLPNMKIRSVNPMAQGGGLSENPGYEHKVKK